MSVARHRSLVEQFFEALRVLHVSLIVSFLAVALLALPPQVRDLYRTLAESARGQQDVTAASAQIAVTALLFMLAAYLAYYVARHRARVHLSRTTEPGHALVWFLRWGPPLCGALLIVGWSVGMYLSTLDIAEIPGQVSPDIDRIVADMKVAAIDLRWAAIAAAVTAIVFLFSTRAWDAWTNGSVDAPTDFAFGPLAQLAWGAVGVGMTCMAFFPELSVPFSQQAGSLAIFLVFICVLLVVLSVLQTWSDRHGVPWTLVLIGWSVAIALLDLNKPGVTLVDRPQTVLTQVQDRFLDWHEARKDKSAFAGEPYPVFLVSAEAGGLYAAQFTAKVLARLQDRCESFAQHVFAISGVSGGSLGAAIFSNLARQRAANAEWKPCRLEGAGQQGSFERSVDAVLKRDFLAPIVSRALFADLVQHFIPTRLPDFLARYLPESWHEPSQSYRKAMAQFSRGRAFEETIELAWADGTAAGVNGGASAFARPFLAQWQPSSAGPALILNTTSVNDGRQVFIAPFGTGGNLTGYDNGLLYYEPAFPETKDLTLAAAISLSGRFPWVLPASTVGSDKFAVVDGAYFESSGIETLNLIRSALRPYEVKPEGTSVFPYIKVYVIVIGSFHAPVDDSTLILDEATPPVRTLLNARDRRGYNAYNTLLSWDHDVQCPPKRPEASIAGGEICRQTVPVLFRLNYDHFNLPLGWTLSEGLSRIIDQHARGRCRDDPGTPLPRSDPRQVLHDNIGSAAYFVPYYLSPKPKEGEASGIEYPCGP